MNRGFGWIALAVMVVTGALAAGRAGAPAAAAAGRALETSPGNSKEAAMEEQITVKEREGLDALEAGNLEAFGKLTAEDAVFVDAHGAASKEQVMKNVGGFKLTEYSMDGVKFLPLSSKSGLISYKVQEKGVSHGKEFSAQAYVSSIWGKRGKEWVCLFSQETTAR